MVQLMPLPLTVSCFSKILIGFTFLVLAHLGSPRQRAVKWVSSLLYSIELEQMLVLILNHIRSTVDLIGASLSLFS